MHFRDPINTDSLQKKFPEVYREFFGKCDLVLSTGLHFPWLNNSITKYVGAMIQQKIPLKLYVGFQKNKSGKLSFVNYQEFYSDQNVFFRDDESLQILNTEVILETLGSLWKKDHATGYNIHVLSEAQKGKGFGQRPSLASLLAVMIGLLNKDINDLTIQKWTKTEGTSLLVDKIFQKIHKNAYQVDKSFFSSTFRTPVHTLPALLNEQGLWFRYKAQDGQNENGHIADTIPIWPWDKRNKSPNIFPFDYVLVNTKVRSHIQLVYDAIERDVGQIGSDVLSFKKTLGKSLGRNSLFNKLMTRDFGKDLYEHLGAYLVATFLILTEELKKTLVDQAVASKFLAFINKTYEAAMLFEQASPQLDTLRHTLLNKQALYPIGINSCMSTKIGGNLLVVMPLGQKRDLLWKAIEEIQQSGTDVSIDYCSWIDGTYSSGIVIEQSIQSHQLSPLLDANMVFSQDSISTKILSYELALAQKYDLLLDTISNKIYIGGTSVTSKDLHSQHATIKILQQLIDHISEEISNASLEKSSYSNSKNELQGKIILPLKDLVYKRTGKKLSLTVKGNLHSFYLKLGESKVSIVSIKPLYIDE